MSFWADQFVEVCYRAQQFHLAYRQVQNPIPSLCLIQYANLAYARMNLECALATYQLCRYPLKNPKGTR